MGGLKRFIKRAGQNIGSAISNPGRAALAMGTFGASEVVGAGVAKMKPEMPTMPEMPELPTAAAGAAKADEELRKGRSRAATMLFGASGGGGGMLGGVGSVARRTLLGI